MKRLLLLTLLFISQINFSQNEFILAENYFSEGEFEKATQLYKALYEKNPQNTTYLKRLISCYQETTEFKKAESLLKNQLENNPQQTYLFVEIGYNYDKQQQKELAINYYNMAINSIEQNPVLGSYIGNLFKENALLDYAILAYEKTMKLKPNSNYNFQIAQIYGEQGEFEKMFQSYIDLLETNDGYLTTVQRFTSKYIDDDAQSNNNNLFKKIIIKKSVGNPKDVWNQLLSWLYVQEKSYGKALVQEKALFARDPSYISNILNLGYISFDDKAYPVSQECFDFILNNSSVLEFKLTAYLFDLKIAMETKHPNIEEKFMTIFNQFGKNNATIQIQIAYAEYVTFQKNEPEKAIGILNEALEVASSKFETASIKLKLGDIYVFTGKFNKALIYFSQVQTSIKDHPLSQEARFKVAQTSFFKNDFKWAIAQLKVLKSSTTQLIANDALELFLIISDNQPKDSVSTGLAQYAKADLLAYQQKNHQAIDTLQQVIQKFKGQNIEDEALYKQAGLFFKIKQYEDAVQNYLTIIELNKEGIYVDDALYQLAEIYQNKLNNTKKALEYYQKIIFEHPSSIYLVDARKKYRKLRGDAVQ